MKRKARRFLSGCLAALLLASTIPVKAASGNAQEVRHEEESVSSEILTEPEQVSERSPEEAQGQEEVLGQEGNAEAVLPGVDIEVQPELKENPAEMNEQMEIVEELLGDNAEQALTVENEDEGLPMVRLGGGYSAVVKTDGSLWMWGANGYGQLGDGTTTMRLKPVKILEDVKSVSLSRYCSAAIRTDGSLWMWGYNGLGQLGDGTTTMRLKPVKILEDVKSVSLSSYGYRSAAGSACKHGHSAAIKTDGSLWMWGCNDCGQLGDGTTRWTSSPVKVMDGVKSISLAGYVALTGPNNFTGYGSSAAIKTDGSLWMWGYNEYGQLGDGTTVQTSSPVKVMDEVKSVSLVGYEVMSSAAIKTDGSLWMWGYNKYGQLGDGTTRWTSSPVKVMDGVKSVSLVASGPWGAVSSAAIKTDGSLWMWGNNKYGQLGDGTTTDRREPMKVMDGVKSVSGSSAAIKTDGSLWMWGANEYGQLGDGTTENRSSPVKILDGVKSVSGSSAAIKTDGSLWMWGYNGSGRLGDGTTTDRHEPVKIMDVGIPTGDDPTPPTSLVTKFSIDATQSGTVGDLLTITGNLDIKNDSMQPEPLQTEIDALKWVSSDPSIAEVTGPAMGVFDYTNNSASLLVHVTLHQVGTVQIAGTASNGQTAVCEVKILSANEPDVPDIDESIQWKKVGKLEALSEYSVTLDGQEHKFSCSINPSAYTAMKGKTVCVVSRAVDTNIFLVTDLVCPSISISCTPDSLNYQNGKFNKKKFDVTVSMSTSVKFPDGPIGSYVAFSPGELKGTEAEDVTVEFSGYTMDLGDKLYRQNLLNSESKYTSDKKVRVKFGEQKTFRHTIHLNKDYVPETVKDALEIQVSSTVQSQTVTNKGNVYVANLDKQAENAVQKNDGTDVSQAEALLDKITLGVGPVAFSSAGYTNAQSKAIESAISLWIANIFVTDIFTQSTENNTIWNTIFKEAGMTSKEQKKFLQETAKKAFKGLGVDLSPVMNADSPIHISNTEAGTRIRLYHEDGKKFDTINVDLSIGNYSFTGQQAFGGFGDIELSIKTADKGTFSDKGVVTFADLTQFANSMSSICESELKKIYNMDIGENLNKGASWIRKKVNKTTKNKAIAMLTSETANKIIEKKFGTFSDNVFKLYTRKIIGYSNGKVTCPVDVYIYNSAGKLCGSIVDNQIAVDTGEIFLYCVGDEKFFSLTGDDYTVKLVGYGEGTMTYELEEYQGEELLRTLSYRQVPLSKGKTYTTAVPKTQLLDSGVYNLFSDDEAEEILPSDDTKPEPDIKPAVTETVTPSVTPTPSITPEPSITPAPSETPTPSVTPTPNETPKPSITPKPNKPSKPTNAATFKTHNAYYRVYKNGTAKYLRPIKKNLGFVTIPSTVKIKGVIYKVTSIGNKAFINNKKLKKVTISNNIVTIGNSAFQGCKALKTVTIGKRVKTIGKKTFYGDGRLKAITVKSNVLKRIGSKALYGIYKKTVIKVPKNKLSAYKKLFRNKGQKRSVKVKKM